MAKFKDVRIGGFGKGQTEDYDGLFLKLGPKKAAFNVGDIEDSMDPEAEVTLGTLPTKSLDKLHDERSEVFLYEGELWRVDDWEPDDRPAAQRECKCESHTGYERFFKRSTKVVEFNDGEFTESAAGSKTSGSKGSSSSMELGSFSDQLFRKVENCVYDLRTKQLGVQNDKGISVFVPAKGKTKAKLVTCPFKMFGIPIPAYAIRTPIDQVQPGDVILVTGTDDDEDWMYFTGVTKDGGKTGNAVVEGISTSTNRKSEIVLGEDMLLVGDGVLCVRNIFGKENDLTKLLPLFLLFSKKEGEEESKSKFSKLLLLMLIQGDKNMDFNSLLPLLLLGDEGGSGEMDSLLPFLMLQGGNGGLDIQKLLPLMLLGGGDSNKFLPFLMLQGGNGFDINSMLPMMMLAKS